MNLPLSGSGIRLHSAMDTPLLKLPTVQIENWEGPFDLLLELARADKVDISQVYLALITDSFVRHVRTHAVSSDLVADFLVVASTLLLIKLRHLLPAIEQSGEADEVLELTDRIRIYQLYRQQAQYWRTRWCVVTLYPRAVRLPVHREITFPPMVATDLCVLMHTLIQRMKEPQDKRRHLRPRGRSLQECLHLFQERLEAVEELIFHEAVVNQDAATIAVSFLAVLELVRRQKLLIKQSESFGPLVLRGRPAV